MYYGLKTWLPPVKIDEEKKTAKRRRAANLHTTARCLLSPNTMLEKNANIVSSSPRRLLSMFAGRKTRFNLPIAGVPSWWRALLWWRLAESLCILVFAMTPGMMYGYLLDMLTFRLSPRSSLFISRRHRWAARAYSPPLSPSPSCSPDDPGWVKRMIVAYSRW